MMEKGSKVNVKKTKTISASERTAGLEASKFPCSVCRKEYEETPFYASNVNCRVHRRCSGVSA